MRAKTQIVIKAYGYVYTFNVKLTSANDFLLDYVIVNSEGVDDDHVVPLVRIPDNIQIDFYKQVIKARDNLRSNPST